MPGAKTILITGGSSGIGKATVSALAAMGHRICFIARNRSKAESVKNKIIASTGNKNVTYILADLASKKQIKECVETYKKKYQSLDVLINNAGVCLPERRITRDGMEETFEINHLSYFMFGTLLLDLLKKSDDPRIINVSSGGHASGKFDPANFQSEKIFTPFGTYFNTKLLNILFTLELAERLKGTRITVNALHPGVVNTGFGKEFRGTFGFLNRLAKHFMISSKRGAKTSVYLATSDEVKNITGRYFIKCKQAETKNSDITPENRKVLWEASLKLSE